MADDPLDFLDQKAGSSQATADPLDFLDQSLTDRQAPFRKTSRHAAQMLKGSLNLNPVVAGYNLLTSSLSAGAHRNRQRVTEQAQKDLQMMDEKVARGVPLSRQEKYLYDRTKQWAERVNQRAAPIDTESLINRAVKATSGIDLEPEDIGEEISNIGASIVSPRGLAKAGRAISKLALREARLGLSKGGWESLRKGFKGNPEKEGIINWAEQKGLTPREATLLMQPEKKIGALKKVSKKTKQLERDVAGLKEKLGSSYDELRAIGRQGGYLGSKEALPLLDKLGKIEEEINLTHALGPESAAAKNVLSETIRDIENNGTTIERLIATRQNLGQGVNWNKIGVKANLKGRMKDAITETIDKANPVVGKELQATDQAYQKYKKFQEFLDNRQSFTMVNGIPVPSSNVIFWGALGTKLLMGMNPLKAGTYYGIKEGISRLSTAMLTNPHLQGIRKKLMQAVLSGNTEKQRKLMVLARKIIKKDDPQLYEELGLED